MVLKRRYFKLDMHFDINISQVSKTEEIISAEILVPIVIYICVGLLLL